MTDRRSDNYYRELEDRLRSLIPLAVRLLSPEVVKWYTEYLDAGEYGLAVEVAADGFPTDATPSRFRELAIALLAEAELMGLSGPATNHLRALVGSEP
jgi:hypothetical protein